MPMPEQQQLLNDLEDLLRKSPELERRLPVRPEEPLTRDCCGQSCAPCIFDLYRSELDDWARTCWRLIRPGENEETAKDQLERSSESPVFSFQPNSYRALKLISITPSTHDTNIYRFSLPSSDQRLFLPVGSHLIMRGCFEVDSSSEEGEKKQRISGGNGGIGPGSRLKTLTVRQFTPITKIDTTGYMDLMIKLYPHGRMSSYLRHIQKEFERGAEVWTEFRGPYGLFTYRANENADLLMLAAGTGLAPMAQIIEHILQNDDVDMTRIRLLMCCRRYDEILLKDRLDDWRRRWNFSVCYVLSQWREEIDRLKVKYGDEIVGGSRLDQQRIIDEVQRLKQLEHQRGGGVDNAAETPGFKVLVCGTKSFEKDMMNYLLKAGVVAKRIFRF